MLQLVVWRVGLREFALPFAVVSQVVRAVAVSATSDMPPFSCGMVDIRGDVVPVIDVRKRFSLPERSLAPADHFIVAHTPKRTLVLWVDMVHGVAEYPDDAATFTEGSNHGMAMLPDGLILLHDLEQCLAAAHGMPLAELAEALP